MDKFKASMETLLRWLLILFAGFVVMISFAEPLISYDNHMGFMLLALVCYSALLYCVFRLCQKLPEIYLIRGIRIGIILALIIQLVIVFQIQVIPQFDLSHIYDQCMKMFKEQTVEFTHEKYFGFYTNNIPLAILIYWVFRFGRFLGCTNYRIVGGVFNVLLLSEVYILTWHMFKKITNTRVAAFVMFLLLTNPMYYAFASYYYTDITSMGFLVPGVFLLFRGNRQEHLYKRIFSYIGAGLFMGMAIKLRVTSLFILLALLVFLVWKRYRRELVEIGLGVLGGLLIFSILWNGIYHYHVKFDTKDSAVTVTHFVMMGSRNKGTYSGEDVKFTKSFPTHKERVENNLRVWKERIKENGIIGNIKLAISKEAITWGVGTKEHYNCIKKVVEETLCWRLIAGDKSFPFRGYMQAYNLIIFLLIGLGLYYNRNERNYMLILSIYWLGAVVFYLFWEAHKRHSLSFLILLIYMVIPFAEKLLKNESSSTCLK